MPAAPQAYWYNKNNSYERASTDCRDCLYQAKIKASDEAEETEGYYKSTSPERQANEQTIFENCMKEKGYTKTWDYKIDYKVQKGTIEVNHKTYDIAGK